MIVEILRWDKFIFFYARYHKIDNIRTTSVQSLLHTNSSPNSPEEGKGKKEQSSVKTTKPPPTTRRFEKKKQFERRRNPISKELECNIQSSIQRYTRRWTREREREGERERQRWNLLCILHSPRLKGKLEGVVIAGMATGTRFMEKLWLRCRSRAPHFQLNNAITASRRKPTLLYSFHHFLPFHRCFRRCNDVGCVISLSLSFCLNGCFEVAKGGNLWV